MLMLQRSFVAPAVLAIVVLVAACDGGAREAHGGPLPELVSIARGTTTYGFFASRERVPVEVDAFRIAKRPTTVAEYKKCVAAGACSDPANDACIVRGGGGTLGVPTYEIQGAERLPATCVGIAQAKAYCSWVGGALPATPPSEPTPLPNSDQGSATAGARSETRVVSGATVTPKGQAPMRGNVDVSPTLDRIRSGGAFPHKNDGSIFMNREGRLPSQPSGYYREFVHPTPGVNGPGPQRIIAGARGEYYYTPEGSPGLFIA